MGEGASPLPADGAGVGVAVSLSHGFRPSSVDSTKQKLELETKPKGQKGQALTVCPQNRPCREENHSAPQPERVTGLCQPTPTEASGGGSREQLTKNFRVAVSDLAP